MFTKTLKFWFNVPISKKLYIVVGFMASLIIVELLTLGFAMNNLSAVRAFVGGEGLWTKGQKQAIYQLQRYAFTKDKKDYDAFLQALKVNDGDHIARLELSRSNPDLSIVKKGFIQGQIHPDDILPMVQLLKRFGHISYISKAVMEWQEGDVLIDELKRVGSKYHDLIESGQADFNAYKAMSDKVHELNKKLSIVTAEFSLVLGQGSRWLENLVFYILFSLVLTVECVGLTLTFLTSRSLSDGLKSLIRVADSIGQGDFAKRVPVKSGDEIGKLSESVNTMGEMLERNYSELEEKIKDRTHKLDEALKSRDEFISIASHELRTPITALILQLEMLEMFVKKDSPLDSDKISLQAHKASLMGKRLAGLQNVLMDLTRISVGKLELNPTKVDLNALVSDSVIQLGPEHRSLIQLNSSTDVTVQADPIRLGQVITNLLTNAIKYGDHSLVEVDVSSSGPFALVKVKDNGPGIPKDKQDQIFERYERLEDKGHISGLGLGLYIAKQITLAHNGDLTLESRPGQGCCFTVRIPQAA